MRFLRRLAYDRASRKLSTLHLTKEIDHLIERVSAIEQHLGLRRNIAA